MASTDIGVDLGTASVLVYITGKGDESCSECISFKLQGDDDADWTFNFDDWDDDAANEETEE